MADAGIVTDWSPQAIFVPPYDCEARIAQGKQLEQQFIDHAMTDPDGFSLKMTVFYGLRGVCAYLHHVGCLEQHDPSADAFVHQVLATLDDRNRALYQ